MLTALLFTWMLLLGCNAGKILPWRSAVTPGTDSSQLRDSCKRGLAYNAGTATDFASLRVALNWYYTWSVHPTPAALASDGNTASQFIPMIWGTEALAATSAQDLPTARFLLGFNEPNFVAQSDLTASAAAALWPQIEALAQAQNMRIVSPAVNYCSGNCTATSPFDWLDQFFAACPKCQVDAVAVHSYTCVPAALQAYLAQVETRYQRPVWLTEFSCLDTPAPSSEQQLNFMQAVVPLLEADPMVQRYAWFTGRDPDASAVDLLTADGTLTPLGQAYVSLPQQCRP